jgi:uncharacterized protein YkwD
MFHRRQGSPGSYTLKPFINLSLLVAAFAPLSLSAAAWSSQEMLVFELVNHQRSINNQDPLRWDDRLHAAAVSHSQSMADNGFFSHTTLRGGNGEVSAQRISYAGYRFTVSDENIAVGHGRFFDSNDTLVQLDPMDAAHHVMYGTADLNEYNAFFSNSVDSWDEVGVGISGDDWNAWHNRYVVEEEGEEWVDKWDGEWNGYCDFDGDGKADGACSRDGGWMGSQGHRETMLSDLFEDIGVGYVWDPDDTTPILWDEGEISFPLNTYWTQDFAAGDSLAPVPLPGALWLLLSGLGGLVILGRGGKGT